MHSHILVYGDNKPLISSPYVKLQKTAAHMFQETHIKMLCTTKSSHNKSFIYDWNNVKLLFMKCIIQSTMEWLLSCSCERRATMWVEAQDTF